MDVVINSFQLDSLGVKSNVSASGNSHMRLMFLLDGGARTGIEINLPMTAADLADLLEQEVKSLREMK